MPTHFDIVVLIAVCFGLILAALGYPGWRTWQITSSTQEIERLTKAVGTLVLQETGKIRTLLNR